MIDSIVETEACYFARMQRQQRQQCTQPASQVDHPPQPNPVRQPATQSDSIESKIDRAIIFQIEMSRPPVLLMSVINPVARQIGWASKREKLAIKRHVLSRIGALIKAEKLRRVQRRYVQKNSCLMPLT